MMLKKIILKWFRYLTLGILSVVGVCIILLFLAWFYLLHQTQSDSIDHFFVRKGHIEHILGLYYASPPSDNCSSVGTVFHKDDFPSPAELKNKQTRRKLKADVRLNTTSQNPKVLVQIDPVKRDFTEIIYYERHFSTCCWIGSFSADHLVWDPGTKQWIVKDCQSAAM